LKRNDLWGLYLARKGYGYCIDRTKDKDKEDTKTKTVIYNNTKTKKEGWGYQTEPVDNPVDNSSGLTPDQFDALRAIVGVR
jgi:hypothetical protein